LQHGPYFERRTDALAWFYPGWDFNHPGCLDRGLFHVRLPDERNRRLILQGHLTSCPREVKR
jgi:hypothetical protein